jgi:ubiquinone biosynthesis protein
MAGWFANAWRAVWVACVVLAFVCVYGARRLALSLTAPPNARRARIAALQGRMLRVGMGLLGACFVKLGQVMSSRPDLFEPELIAELRRLQDKVPPFPFTAVRSALEAQLKAPLESVFVEFDPVPVAAASVAQVHRARLCDGSEVAVKVLRPNVRAQVARDGALLMWCASLLALHPEIRRSDPQGFARTFVQGLLRQTDLRQEAENYETFRKNFADDPRIDFPRVYAEYSGERVLVMEFVRGEKLDALGPGDHGALATALREASMKMCFVDGFMHADMHPGNMVRREDGVLVLFDVGLATRIPPEVLDVFVDMVKCIAMGSADDMLEHFKRYHLYEGEVDWAALRRDLEVFGQSFRGKPVGQIDWADVANNLMALGRRYHVRPLPELALVLVGTITVQGIGKMLTPDLDPFSEMSRFLVPVLMQRGQALPDTPEARRARAASASVAS